MTTTIDGLAHRVAEHAAEARDEVLERMLRQRPWAVDRLAMAEAERSAEGWRTPLLLLDLAGRTVGRVDTHIESGRNGGGLRLRAEGRWTDGWAPEPSG